MKTILVPVDFSNESRHALNAAVLLADKMQFKIILLHVFNVSVIQSYNETYNSMSGKFYETEWNSADRKLKKMAKEAESESHIECSVLMAEGDSSDKIIEVSEKEKAELIVMGTKRLTGIKKLVNGSVACKVVKESTLPVLIVPNQTELKNKIHTIVMATDYFEGDVEAIKFLSAIAEMFSSKIIVVHVEDGELNDFSEQDILESFAEKIKKSTHNSNIHFQLVKSEKQIGEALEDFVTQTETNILAVSTRKKDFFEKLFTPAITLDTLNHTSVPLLVFHASNKLQEKLN